MSWLDRLPPEYRRRYYTNLAFIGALFVFFIVVGRLGKHAGTLAVLWFVGLLVLFSLAWPLVRLLRSQPRPARSAFALYAAWIVAYAYFAAGIFWPLPGAAYALLLGLVLMLAFFAIYRKAVFPDFFGGAFKDRYAAVRAARQAERENHADFVDSIRMQDK